MAATFHRTFFLNGQAGRLEAMLWTSPVSNPLRVAVVCHPHPLFGGSMHNKVVFRIARAMHHHGFPVLRFNFRGAGLSHGSHDAGRGERDDVRTALDSLSVSFPGKSMVLAGFSFGAWVGLRVGCEDNRVAELVGLGIPVNSSDLSYLTACKKPKLFLQGEMDQFGSRELVESLVANMPEPKQLAIISGADHFFEGRLDQMTAALNAWLVQRFGPPPAEEPSNTAEQSER